MAKKLNKVKAKTKADFEKENRRLRKEIATLEKTIERCEEDRVSVQEDLQAANDTIRDLETGIEQLKHTQVTSKRTNDNVSEELTGFRALAKKAFYDTTAKTFVIMREDVIAAGLERTLPDWESR